MRSTCVGCILAIFAMTSAALATTTNFTGLDAGGEYDFAANANWSAGAPTIADDAVILSENQFVTLESAGAANSLSLGGLNDDSYNRSATMTVRNGGSLTTNTLTIDGNFATGTLRIEDGGTVTVNGATTLGTDYYGYSQELSVTQTGVFATSGTMSIGMSYYDDSMPNYASFTNGGTLLLDINPTGASGNVTGVGTLTLDSLLEFDLSDVAGEDSWAAIDVGTLNETFGEHFQVKFKVGTEVVSATKTPTGVWSSTISGLGVATFAEGTGILTVPEPATLALLASGLVGLLAYAWRRRK